MGYLKFVEIKDSGKTKTFEVINVNYEIVLGWIKWHGAWRKYVYKVKYDDTIFDTKCLQEIISFIDKLMQERKNGSTERK